MSTKNKKIALLVSLGAALFLLLVSSIAFGHGWGRSNWDGGNSLQNWNSQIPEKYSLTSDQMGKIETVLDGWYTDAKPLQQKLVSLRMEMQGYSNRPDANLDEIKSYRNRIRNLEDEISNLRLKANKQIDNILSDDQKTYLGSNYNWCDFGFSCDNMHGMNMNMSNMNGMHTGMNDMCMNANWYDCDMHMSGNGNRYNNNNITSGCCW